MSTLTQFLSGAGGGVKTIQAGTAGGSGFSTSVNTTISTVVLAKSFVSSSGGWVGSSAGTWNSSGGVTVRLTAATTVQTGFIGAPTGNWGGSSAFNVIEFN